MRKIVFLDTLTTLWVFGHFSTFINGHICDADTWRLRSKMSIHANSTLFSIIQVGPTASANQCMDLCIQQTRCRAVVLGENNGQMMCKLYNHSVIALKHSLSSKTIFRDRLNDSCPLTTVWEAPAGWSDEAVPAFYQPFDSQECVTLSGIGIKFTRGKSGQGVTSTGSKSYADIVTPEMVDSDPEVFCWLTPQNCSDGMSFSFWYKYKTSSNYRGIITSYWKEPGGTRNSPGFNIYIYIDNFKVDISGEAFNVGARVREVPVDGTWYNVGFTYGTDHSLKMYMNGVQRATGTTAQASSSLPNLKILRLGMMKLGQPWNYGVGTWDDILVFRRVLDADQMRMLAEEN